MGRYSILTPKKGLQTKVSVGIPEPQHVKKNPGGDWESLQGENSLKSTQNIQIQDLLGQFSLTLSWMVCSTQALKWQSLLLSQRPSTIAASSKVPKIVLSCFWHRPGCHHCNHSWWHLSCCLENSVYFGAHFWFQKDHGMEKLIWDWMADLHNIFLPNTEDFLGCQAKISPVVSYLQRRVHRDQQTSSNAGNLRTTKATVARWQCCWLSCGNVRFLEKAWNHSNLIHHQCDFGGRIF